MSMDGRGLGAPGTRVIEKQDAKTETIRTMLQAGVRVGCDLLTFAAALMLAFAVGRWAIWLVLAAAVLMKGRAVLQWAIDKSESVYINAALIFLQEEWVRAVVCLLFIPLVFNVLSYRWDFDWSDMQAAVINDETPRNYGRSYLTVLRDRTWEYQEWNETTGAYETFTRTEPDNVLHRFPLLLRAVLVALPAAWFLTNGKVRTRLEMEIIQAFPAAVERYSEIGTNPRRWGQKPDPAPQAPPNTVRIERVAPQGARGTKVEGYDDLRHYEEIKAAFEALNGARISWLSRRNLRGLGIGSDVSRDIMEQLEQCGYIEYPNKGSAAELTEYGVGLAEAVREGKF